MKRVVVLRRVRTQHGDKFLLRVLYPSGSRGQCWDHLAAHPPRASARRPGVSVEDNPWRRAHTERFHCWQMFLTPSQTTPAVEDEPLREFDPEIWRSISSKYRTVARLPEGMTAVEALEKFYPDAHAELLRRLEIWARSEFLRMYASRHPSLTADLTPAEWQHFKKSGGFSA